MQTRHFYSEQRAAERFLLSLPVETDRGPGVTRDVSVLGLYLVTDQQLAAGDHLQLVVTLPDRDRSLPLRLSVKGRVIRVESLQGNVGAGIVLDEETTHLAYAS